MLRSRAYYASRIRYCAKSHSTFHQMRLYTSGNIDTYPGPDVCSMCNKQVARNHRAVNCDNRKIWCHIKCASIKPSEYMSFQCLSSFFWWCPRCNSSSLPFASESPAHINVNGLLNKSLDIKALLFSIKFDILAITESHLRQETSDDEIGING